MGERRDDDYRAGDRARVELSESILDGNSVTIRLVVLKSALPGFEAGECGMIVYEKFSIPVHDHATA